MSKKHHAFENYGGRGIRLCKRWQGTVGFGNFLEDMGPRPAGMTLDRKNPQGHYEPTNCRWATRDVQANNQARYLWPDGALPVEKVREMEQRIREDAEFASDYAYSF
jgi:hypothetical protein